MIQISGKTISQTFNEACRKWPEQIFLCSPSSSKSNLIELPFKKVKELVEHWTIILREAGGFIKSNESKEIPDIQKQRIK